jgi:ATP-dependent DNA helicase
LFLYLLTKYIEKEIANKKLGNPLLQLRLVCNSPHMFYNPWASDANMPMDESIVTASGKMLLLDRLLPALFKRGHKVLIFSQFKVQLDLLEAYCRELRGWNVCRIDGGVAQEDRRSQIEEFNTNKKMKIFLLSTRAGGQGINLASADTVILFDSDWNPQQDLQAQDRAHRIGQTRPVIVYRLATKGTVEESLLLSADAKRRLEKLVIKKGGFRTMSQKMDTRETIDKETLRNLLLKDGEVYKFSGDREILSDQDLAVLCDRYATLSLSHSLYTHTHTNIHTDTNLTALTSTDSFIGLMKPTPGQPRVRVILMDTKLSRQASTVWLRRTRGEISKKLRCDSLVW